MGRSRRNLLVAAGVLGGTGLSGCLRLRSDGEAVDTSETTTDTDGAAETAPDPETATATADRPAVVSCESGPLPTETTEQVTHPFVDSRNSFSLPNRTAPSESPCLAWQMELPVQASRVFTGPIITRDHVISYDRSGFTARDRDDGTVAWEGISAPGGELRFGQPLGLHGRTLVVAGQNDRTDNLIVLAVDAEGSATASTVVYEGDDPNQVRLQTGRVAGDLAYLVVGDSDADETRIVTVDWRSDDVVQEATIGPLNLNLEDMAVGDDTIVITSDETADGADNVWAVSRDDGTVRWSARLPIGESLPILGGDNLYLSIDGYEVEGVDDHVRAISTQTGETVWEFEVRSSPRSGVAVDGQRVYIIANGALYAVDPASGDPQWQFSPESDPGIQGTADGLPIVCRETLLLGSDVADEGVPARVRAVDKTSGELQWSVGVPGSLIQSPLPVDGVLYAAVEDRSGDETRATLYSFY